MIPGCCAVPLNHVSMVRLQLALNVRDGMCFTTSSGSICKDGSIISIQYAVQQVLGRGLVNIALRDILVKHLVESESMIFSSFRSWTGVSGESMYLLVFWWIKNPRVH